MSEMSIVLPAPEAERARPSTPARTRGEVSLHLDAMRGLAAMVVFISHLRGNFLQSGLRNAIAGNSITPNLAQHAESKGVFADHLGRSFLLEGRVSVGHLAVIAFFVLSGYFVGGSVLRNVKKDTFLWKTYLLHRLTRLWVVLVPALILGLALDLIGLQFLNGPHSLYSGFSGSDVPVGLLRRCGFPVFAGNLFFLQGIFVDTLGTNGPLWSLSFEFWFYIIFPFVALLIAKRGRLSQRIGWAAVVLLLLVFVGGSITAYFIIWLLGAWISTVRAAKNERISLMGQPVAAALLLTVMYMELRHPIWPYVSDLILSVVYAFLLWTLTGAWQPAANSIYGRAAHRLASMSYTLYLVHYPILVFVANLALQNGQRWRLSLVSFARVGVIGTGVFITAYLVYWVFERNTDYFRSRLLIAVSEA